MNAMEALMMWIAVGGAIGASSAALLRYWTNASFATLTLIGVAGSVGWGMFTNVLSGPAVLNTHIDLLDTMLLPMFGAIIAIAFVGSFSPWRELRDTSSSSAKLVR